MVPQTYSTGVQQAVKKGFVYSHWLYLPENYGKRDKKWPLILFLHGAGETGTELENVKRIGPPKLLDCDKHKDIVPELYQFIVVSPQTPAYGWNPSLLSDLLDEVIAEHAIDTRRIYLTGISMGGNGAYVFASYYPEFFAALLPIAAWGGEARMRNIVSIPTWAFHGDKDNVIPLSAGKLTVDQLKKLGGDVRFTVYPGIGHDSWSETYLTPEVYKWLLKNRKVR